MLVLSRKKDEAIIIGDQITVTVLEIRGNRVRLGIQAPDEVRVQRSEICWRELEPCTAGESVGTVLENLAGSRELLLTP